MAVGADLDPSTLLGAYQAGYFAMPIHRRKIGWFSPDPRGVLLPGKLQVSRSLRRSMRRYHVTVDRAFLDVVHACGDPDRPHGWIDRRMIRAYAALHHLGWAHSLEVWDDEGLAGGLFGISIGGFFAGESMFHRRVDASKVALVHLVDMLGDEPNRLLDVQWSTPHLASLGIEPVSRHDYAGLLEAALPLTKPTPFVTPLDLEASPLESDLGAETPRVDAAPPPPSKARHHD